LLFLAFKFFFTMARTKVQKTEEPRKKTIGKPLKKGKGKGKAKVKATPVKAKAKAGKKPAKAPHHG
jgi:hypothetical protein